MSKARKPAAKAAPKAKKAAKRSAPEPEPVETAVTVSKRGRARKATKR